MLTANLMASMGDQHLIAALRAEIDPLTSTSIEIELLNRFEKVLQHSSIIDLVEEHEINDSEIAALGEALAIGVGIANLSATVALLDEFSATEPGTLRDKLERADKFYNIAGDAGDVIARLNDLINSTL